jgi:hypothetical protein
VNLPRGYDTSSPHVWHRNREPAQDLLSDHHDPPRDVSVAYDVVRSSGVSSAAVNSEDAWRSLQQVNEWVRFADTKAAAVLAGSGVLGGVLVAAVPSLADFRAHTTRAVLLSVAIICVGVSSLLSLRILAPRLRTGEPRSLIYFDHIARRYAADCNGFVDNYLALARTADDLSRQVAEQIWSNSRVARRKFVRVSLAVRFLGVAMVAAGLAVVVQRLWG